MKRSDLSGLFGLLGQEDSLDVGEDTTLGDGHTGKQLVQLFVVSDGQLKVTGDDASLLVVAGGVTGQLENFGGEVLEHGSQVDRGTGTDSFGVVALAKQTMDTTDGELETSSGRAGLGLSLDFASLATTRHFAVRVGLGLRCTTAKK